MAVALSWQGPVGPGHFPEDPLIFENLCEAGVYLGVKTYDGNRLIAYAGQSVSLLARFDQHLSSMLSLSAPLRDASGTTVFTGDAGARIAAYGNLANTAALAAADTGRVRFWYTRLMRANEEGTLARFRAHRTELVEPNIAEYKGRIVKLMGDGLLVEFASAVDAVRCAIPRFSAGWQRGSSSGTPALR